MEQVLETALGVVIAVAVSAILFVGANKWFDLARSNWSWFSMVTGGLVSGVLAGVLAGNRLSIWRFTYEEGSSGTTAWLYVLIAVALGALLGALVSGREGLVTRLVIGGGGGLLLGAFHGFFLAEGAYPRAEIVPLLVWPIAGAVVGYGWAMLSGGNTLRRAIDLATVGWVVGAWLVPTIGGGTRVEAISAMAVLGLGVGARIAVTKAADYYRRDAISVQSRATIFLAPAIFFISVSLVIPTIRTIYLSFLDARSVEAVGLQNYATIFTDPGIFKVDLWETMFVNRFFLAGAVLLSLGIVFSWVASRARGNSPSITPVAAGGAAGVLTVVAFIVSYLADRAVLLEDAEAAESLTNIGIRLGEFGVVVLLVALGWLVAQRVRGRHGLDWAPSTGGAAGFGIFFLLFGVFAALRGTIFNNLWWVLVVVALATSLGLAIAVLADRSSGETIAKSLIFMPMAISFVGAGIIWVFMYVSRPIQKEQTGILNSPWVWLGEVSTGQNETGRLILTLLLVLFAGFLAYLAYRGLAAKENGLALGSFLSAVPPIWLLWRTWEGSGIGGVVETEAGFLPETIFFLQDAPYNNFWLMLVLVWIQTGFAMVIMSAAIKAVPAELIEASKVDGATEGQTFWGITIPQIMSTIGVVVTTLIVLVMKVFDIVKVMTNGNFGTQVLANEMWQKAFTESDFGVGSAVAVVLFLSVVPIMYINIRRMQGEGA